MLYNPKGCREKKVCPFLLLENSRPLSPWGPLDFLSACLGIDSSGDGYHSVLLCPATSPLVSAEAAGSLLTLDLHDPQAAVNSHDLTALTHKGLDMHTPVTFCLRAKVGQGLQLFVQLSLLLYILPVISIGISHGPFPWLSMAEGRGPLAKYSVKPIAPAKLWILEY